MNLAPIDLSKERSKLRAYADRKKLAKFLFDLSQQVAKGELENPPYGALVILCNPNEPEIAWKGMSPVDLSEARMVLDEEYMRVVYGAKGSKTSAVQRSRARQAENRRAKREYEREQPWICESTDCGRRFRTERGATRHERVCRCLRRAAESKERLLEAIEET
jgi:hypothetical protein